MIKQDSSFLPFALPSIGEEEINEVTKVLRSGWLTTGAKAKEFEKDFATFIGSPFALAVNSATSGLHLALEAIGIGSGDRVVTTPYTFTATAEIIRYLGADPLFVDIDPTSFNIDPEKIAEVLEKERGVKALMPVHFAGLACDMGAVCELAKRHDLKVVEDAAHALPTTCQGKMVGTFGDMTVYSFYVTKTIATGEGGMVVTANAGYAERMRTMRLHGISRDVFDRYSSTKPSWYYEVVAPGFKYNLTDIAAAIGIHQLRKAWQFQERRAEMAERYDEAFRNLPILLPPQPREGDTHSWHLYVIRLTDHAHIARNLFIERMAEKGIGCSVHFIPLHIQPYWRDRYNYKPGDFPNAYHAYERAVSLPNYPKMTDTDQERVIEAVLDILS